MRLLGLAAGFGLLILIVFANALFVGRQDAANESVTRTLELKNRLSSVLSLLQDAETGQRGFLLTSDENYLAPYDVARKELPTELDALAEETKNAPDQKERVASLREVAGEKLAELGSTIDLKRAGRDAEAVAIVRSDNGRKIMDRARDIIAGAQKEAERLLGERQSEAKTAARALQVGTGLAVLIVVGIAIMVIGDARRRIRELVSIGTALQTANRDLVQAAATRESIEGQLRQSQKMEAIGQLAGGVAHDFNNMLAIIIGNLNLLKRRLERGETHVTRFADNALEGADRAATLTKRILAFSRQQPLVPEPIDANKTVAGMSELLRRTLGEETRVETVLAGGLWRTNADATQVENAILNLALNSRDAMPDGGKLTIETANAFLDEAYAAQNDIPAGQYVMIAITDTGVGMTQEVVRRAFDPFFTTKPTGKGTGLGLSQVYGFVKQSAGHIKIYSEIGQGTTIKIYLKRFFGADALATEQAGKTPAVVGGNPREIILVVEDEDKVRKLTVETLRDLNYTVIHADGASRALQLLDGNPDVQLLLTDVVMPEINGRKLAEEALKRRPDLKVLYFTGYTRNAIVHNGMLDPGVQLITKPFTLEQLAGKVREVLGQSA